MKQMMKLAGIIAVAAIIGFGLSACDEDKSDDEVTVGNWKWGTYTDKNDGGTSTVAMKVSDAKDKITFSGNVAKISGKDYGYVGAIAVPNAATLTAIKAADSIKFKILGDGKKYKIEVRLSSITDHDHYQRIFNTENGKEVTIDIPYNSFKQEGWGKKVEFNKQNITEICFQARAENHITNTGSYEFTVWDIKAGEGGNENGSDCDASCLAIGATGPGGGKIIYHNHAGFTVTGADSFTAYYLEAADYEERVSWSSNNYFVVTGATGEAIGTGKANTAAIIAAYPDDTVSNNAAKAAAAYTGGGKDDWFLPSRYELFEMFNARTHLNISSETYWSSSQDPSSPTYARAHYFGDSNSQGLATHKSNTEKVRAVRAF